MKLEKIKPGMTLYDRHSHGMGNTTLRTLGEWNVYIVSVDLEARTAQVRWNGNREETWYERRLKNLKDWSMSDPGVEVVKGMFDRVVSVKKIKKAKPVKEKKS